MKFSLFVHMERVSDSHSQRELYGELLERHKRLVVFDLHSYNHRRDGADGREADPEDQSDAVLGADRAGAAHSSPPVMTPRNAVTTSAMRVLASSFEAIHATA